MNDPSVFSGEELDDNTEELESETLQAAIRTAEVDRFFGALKAIGAGVVVIVHDKETRGQWRRTFKEAEKAGVLLFHPLIRIDKSVPPGAIQIQDVDDRPPEEDEAASQEGVSEGGVILPSAR